MCKDIRCRSIVLTRSFSNGIRQREVSLSVVISDLRCANTISGGAAHPLVTCVLCPFLWRSSSLPYTVEWAQQHFLYRSRSSVHYWCHCRVADGMHCSHMAKQLTTQWTCFCAILRVWNVVNIFVCFHPFINVWLTASDWLLCVLFATFGWTIYGRIHKSHL